MLIFLLNGLIIDVTSFAGYMDTSSRPPPAYGEQIHLYFRSKVFGHPQSHDGGLDAPNSLYSAQGFWYLWVPSGHDATYWPLCVVICCWWVAYYNGFAELICQLDVEERFSKTWRWGLLSNQSSRQTKRHCLVLQNKLQDSFLNCHNVYYS